MRPFGFQDITPVIDFLYRGPREIPFFQSIDLETWPTENEYRRRLTEMAQNPTQWPTVAVEYRGRTIGMHMLDQGNFIALIWNSMDRGQGVSAVSWFKACQYFFENFGTEMIYFRIPKDNAMALNAAKKLPLTAAGEEDMRVPGFKLGMRVKLYTLSRDDFDRLNSTDDGDEVDEESDL